MGSPTILFNNAGLTLKHGVVSASEITIEQFEETWRANCGSAFLLTQLCLPAMERVGWGRIVFCSSVAGFTGGVVGPHYAYALLLLPQGAVFLIHYCLGLRNRRCMVLFTGSRRHIAREVLL